MVLLIIFRKIEEKFRFSKKSLGKVCKSIDEFKYKGKQFNFLFSFWKQFFFALLLSPWSENTNLFRNFEIISAGTYPSQIPTLRKCQKAQIVLNFI